MFVGALAASTHHNEVAIFHFDLHLHFATLQAAVSKNTDKTATSTYYLPMCVVLFALFVSIDLYFFGFLFLL